MLIFALGNGLSFWLAFVGFNTFSTPIWSYDICTHDCYGICVIIVKLEVFIVELMLRESHISFVFDPNDFMFTPLFIFCCHLKVLCLAIIMILASREPMQHFWDGVAGLRGRIWAQSKYHIWIQFQWSELYLYVLLKNSNVTNSISSCQ